MGRWPRDQDSRWALLFTTAALKLLVRFPPFPATDSAPLSKSQAVGSPSFRSARSRSMARRMTSIARRDRKALTRATWPARRNGARYNARDARCQPAKPCGSKPGPGESGDLANRHLEPRGRAERGLRLHHPLPREALSDCPAVRPGLPGGPGRRWSNGWTGLWR